MRPSILDDDRTMSSRWPAVPSRASFRLVPEEVSAMVTRWERIATCFKAFLAVATIPLNRLS
jgi:hypothetical protein